MLGDLEFIKAAGFNAVRKHVKVENRRWYYHCDWGGLMVWQDHVNADENGRGKTRLSPRWTRLVSSEVGPEESKEPPEGTWGVADHTQFLGELEAMVDVLEHHPGVVVWVPFNEAWGQHRTKEVAQWLERRDPSRLVNAASGGNFHRYVLVFAHEKKKGEKVQATRRFRFFFARKKPICHSSVRFYVFSSPYIHRLHLM